MRLEVLVSDVATAEHRTLVVRDEGLVVHATIDAREVGQHAQATKHARRDRVEEADLDVRMRIESQQRRRRSPSYRHRRAGCARARRGRRRAAVHSRTAARSDRRARCSTARPASARPTSARIIRTTSGIDAVGQRPEPALAFVRLQHIPAGLPQRGRRRVLQRMRLDPLVTGRKAGTAREQQQWRNGDQAAHAQRFPQPMRMPAYSPTALVPVLSVSVITATPSTGPGSVP